MSLRVLLTALVSGLLFGAGLLISDMASPARVLAFLQLGSAWDATLAWVMVSALAVSATGFALARRRGRPLFATRFSEPASTAVDRPLLLGAALFGLGWGLAGFCPGPAVVNAGLLETEGLWFLASMLAGALAAGLVQSRGRQA